MDWDIKLALAVIVVSAGTLICILVSLDREHRRKMDKLTREMKELHKKIDRALGRP